MSITKTMLFTMRFAILVLLINQLHCASSYTAESARTLAVSSLEDGSKTVKAEQYLLKLGLPQGCTDGADCKRPMGGSPDGPGTYAVANPQSSADSMNHWASCPTNW